MGASPDDSHGEMGAGEAASEMERVIQALSFSHRLIVGMSQVSAALNLTSEPYYPPLRTLLEHAQDSAERVSAHLRQVGR